MLLVYSFILPKGIMYNLFRLVLSFEKIKHSIMINKI
jgi:hypothetical protein